MAKRVHRGGKRALLPFPLGSQQPTRRKRGEMRVHAEMCARRRSAEGLRAEGRRRENLDWRAPSGKAKTSIERARGWEPALVAYRRGAGRPFGNSPRSNCCKNRCAFFFFRLIVAHSLVQTFTRRESGERPRGRGSVERRTIGRARCASSISGSIRSNGS